jgi:hypothetical protein
MDAARYIAEIVEPTIADFEANPISVRHAFLACVATYHCIAYLCDAESEASRRQEFREASKDFALVDRLAHAMKHARTGHERSKHIQPLAAGDVMSRPPAFWDVAVWDLSRWDDPAGGVTVKDEVELDIVHAVRGALEFLRAKLAT